LAVEGANSEPDSFVEPEPVAVLAAQEESADLAGVAQARFDDAHYAVLFEPAAETLLAVPAVADKAPVLLENATADSRAESSVRLGARLAEQAVQAEAASYEGDTPAAAYEADNRKAAVNAPQPVPVLHRLFRKSDIRCVPPESEYGIDYIFYPYRIRPPT
jgi:hypothetical protein